VRCVSYRAALAELEEEDHEVPEEIRFASFPLFDTHCTAEGLPTLVMVEHPLTIPLLTCLLIGGRW